MNITDHLADCLKAMLGAYTIPLNAEMKREAAREARAALARYEKEKVHEGPKGK